MCSFVVMESSKKRVWIIGPAVQVQPAILASSRLRTKAKKERGNQWGLGESAHRFVISIIASTIEYVALRISVALVAPN